MPAFAIPPPPSTDSDAQPVQLRRLSLSGNRPKGPPPMPPPRTVSIYRDETDPLTVIKPEEALKPVSPIPPSAVEASATALVSESDSDKITQPVHTTSEDKHDAPLFTPSLIPQNITSTATITTETAVNEIATLPPTILLDDIIASKPKIENEVKIGASTAATADLNSDPILSQDPVIGKQFGMPINDITMTAGNRDEDDDEEGALPSAGIAVVESIGESDVDALIATPSAETTRTDEHPQTTEVQHVEKQVEKAQDPPKVDNQESASEADFVASTAGVSEKATPTTFAPILNQLEPELKTSDTGPEISQSSSVTESTVDHVTAQNIAVHVPTSTSLPPIDPITVSIESVTDTPSTSTSSLADSKPTPKPRPRPTVRSPPSSTQSSSTSVTATPSSTEPKP